MERELAEMRPELDAEARWLVARALFSAVYGVVTLGLYQKLGAVPVAALREQVTGVVETLARGVAQDGGTAPSPPSPAAAQVR